jgi:hypothetical protein
MFAAPAAETAPLAAAVSTAGRPGPPEVGAAWAYFFATIMVLIVAVTPSTTSTTTM